MRILLVEDESKVGRFIQRGLSEVAYACTWVRSITEAEDAHAENPHDMVILDLGLPDGNGLDLLRRWRACGFNEPVIILSARGDMQDRVQGLNQGADDYLAKPFAFEELLARVRSLLRRRDSSKALKLSHKALLLDLEAHAASLGGVPLPLTNREFALLEMLLCNKGRVVTRTQLAESVWEAHHDMETNLIEVYVRKLRQKFEAHPDSPSIRTLRGVGYSLD